ncbi:MAG: diguanylate cyclase [Micavibrio sp.]|nr:diguanylate cyclase [Micavibrio sp.]
MSLDYKKIDRLEKILKLQDAYAHWQMDVMKVMSGHASSPSLPVPPLVMQYVPEDLRENLPEELLQDLHSSNEDLLEWPLKGAIPEDFLERYEDFYHRFRYLRELIFMEESGYEPISGLKNKREMRKDMDLEMSRLSRQGQPFTLALAMIDGFDEIKQALSPEDVAGCIRYIGQSIVECMRPADDAYHPKENEFFLCIRQTDLSGGLRAFQRLGEFLEAQNFTISIDGQAKRLTLTGCVAEPVEGSNVGELIDGLRRDVSTIDKDRGNILTYHEVSPLQRFINKDS